MRNEGTQLVNNMCAGMAVLGAGFANASLQGIEAARQAKLQRIDELNTALMQAHDSGMQIAHADALDLASIALERIADLEAENAILRKAVASRDRVLRNRADV